MAVAKRTTMSAKSERKASAKAIKSIAGYVIAMRNAAERDDRSADVIWYDGALDVLDQAYQVALTRAVMAGHSGHPFIEIA